MPRADPSAGTPITTQRPAQPTSIDDPLGDDLPVGCEQDRHPQPEIPDQPIFVVDVDLDHLETRPVEGFHHDRAGIVAEVTTGSDKELEQIDFSNHSQ